MRNTLVFIKKEAFHDPVAELQKGGMRWEKRRQEKTGTERLWVEGVESKREREQTERDRERGGIEGERQRG